MVEARLGEMPVADSSKERFGEGLQVAVEAASPGLEEVAGHKKRQELAFGGIEGREAECVIRVFIAAPHIVVFKGGVQTVAEKGDVALGRLVAELEMSSQILRVGAMPPADLTVEPEVPFENRMMGHLSSSPGLFEPGSRQQMEPYGRCDLL